MGDVADELSGGAGPRVLAVTTNASLVIGLTFLPKGWDVASQPTTELGLDADIVVIDLGSTGAGLEALRSADTRLPAIVLGDDDPDEPLAANVDVLLRPYTLEDLAARVERLLHPTRTAPSPWTTGAPAAGAGGAGAWGAGSKEAAQAGAVGATEAAAAATVADEQDDVDATDEIVVIDSSSAPSEASAPTAGSAPDRRPLSARMFGRFGSRTRGTDDVSDLDDMPDAMPDGGDPADDVIDLEGPTDATDTEHEPDTAITGDDVIDLEGPTDATDTDDEPDTAITGDDVIDLDDGSEGDDAGAATGGTLNGWNATPSAEPGSAPPSSSPSPSPSSSTAQGDATGDGTLSGIAVAVREMAPPDIDLDAEPATPAVAPTRWRARRQRTTSAPERAMQERLARVLAATSELERLVEEVPLLDDVTSFSRAIVQEVVTQLEADSVGIWRAVDDGWRVVAHHGLTKHEATWRVPADQPLFAEVHATGGAILIDPVDLVQAAVAGIGGAHTESFMAAAIAVGPGRYGIIAVGRNRPLVEADLDLLSDLSLEIAPGMAVAEQLERLRATHA